MKLTRTVYYTNGSSGSVTFEKPPGYHPDSYGSWKAGIDEAEKTGRTVSCICSTYIIEEVGKFVHVDIKKIMRSDVYDNKN